MTMQTPPTPWEIRQDERDGPVPHSSIHDHDGELVAVVYGDTPEQARATADLILAAVNGREPWRAYDETLAVEDRPFRQNVVIVGARAHSGATWRRDVVGEARRGDGPQGYDASDLLRLMENGDIDPDLPWRVTHWRPVRFLDLPSDTGRT
jgi:CO/xanthine dehydrogenase Mo-binding subunit